MDKAWFGLNQWDFKLSPSCNSLWCTYWDCTLLAPAIGWSYRVLPVNIQPPVTLRGVSHHALGSPEKLGELVVPVAVGSVAAEPAANQSLFQLGHYLFCKFLAFIRTSHWIWSPAAQWPTAHNCIHECIMPLLLFAHYWYSTLGWTLMDPLHSDMPAAGASRNS